MNLLGDSETGTLTTHLGVPPTRPLASPNPRCGSHYLKSCVAYTICFEADLFFEMYGIPTCVLQSISSWGISSLWTKVSNGSFSGLAQKGELTSRQDRILLRQMGWGALLPVVPNDPATPHPRGRPCWALLPLRRGADSPEHRSLFLGLLILP